ncbi:putative DUF6848 domain-containing protein [Candidatus Magnetomoraceae bacterium gMMP-15]
MDYQKIKKEDTKNQPIAVEYYTLEAEFEDLAGEEISVNIRVKKPTTSQIERAMSTMQKKTASALKRLLFDVIHPEDKENFRKITDENQGVAVALGNVLLERLGFNSGN